MKHQEIIDLFHARHACKLFDDKKPLLEGDVRTILEAGILSPSSFGMEPWRFIVISTSSLKEALRPFCWDQPQITTCSHLLVICSDIVNPKPQASYTREMFKRRGLSQEMFERYCALYDRWIGRYNEDEFIAWSAKQCYIAAGNMMTTAAMLGIDSCPIEGFEEENVSQVLGLDKERERVVLLLPLGYRVNDVTPKYRRSFESVVEYR